MHTNTIPTGNSTNNENTPIKLNKIIAETIAQIMPNTSLNTNPVTVNAAENKKANILKQIPNNEKATTKLNTVNINYHSFYVIHIL